MNFRDFVVILVMDKEDKPCYYNKIIMCPKSSLETINCKRLIKKAFPEMFGRFGFFKGNYTVFNVCDYEMFPSKFDSKIDKLEKENDWKKIPFVALEFLEIDGKNYCRTKNVTV